ncbi:hypothetical protein [Haliscomenobacter hydrossis]|uniref:Uncharacterized protein n=1 Tax=Haliscomenobacter hydrossis (strain ATCC 27775 / DSM 1100 / LMG 10767 / O) TaxID=760192 RepID=F4L612_HALH1|nr:hypothetical protein [Haliscomenobacter hydrossis]AEE53072.1 hypothetical protein Halhy_5246 [Haliscomenobacter hydrossis DSM 1100]
MESNVDFQSELTKNRLTAVCDTCKVALKDYTKVTAMIVTHQGKDGVIRSYAHTFCDLDENGKKAQDYINFSSSNDSKPITERQSQSHNYAEECQTLKSYFDSNLGNPLVHHEQVFLISADYSLDLGYYFAVPFNDKMLGQLLIFFFARNILEKEEMSRNLSKVIEKINELF